MATTLSQIRLIIERYVGTELENDWVINVCNDAQAEFALSINVPSTGTIALTTTDIDYNLPAELKIINRLWLQSDLTNKIDKEFTWPYRIYNGKIIFRQPYREADTLNMDFYKHMKYFTDIADAIDIDDRFSPLYTSYGQREYYDIPSVKERLGASQALKEYEKHNSRYFNIRQQVISYYAIQNEPAVVDERW